MAVVYKRDLVQRGSEQLDEAKKLVGSGSDHALELADRKIEIANAYARLAESLDQDRYTEFTARNW